MREAEKLYISLEQNTSGKEIKEKRYYLFSYINEQGGNTSSVPWLIIHFGDQLVPTF